MRNVITLSIITLSIAYSAESATSASTATGAATASGAAVAPERKAKSPWKVGILRQIYTGTPDIQWPPKGLDQFKLVDSKVIASTWPSISPGLIDNEPNKLSDSVKLNGVSVYAVKWSGFIYAKANREYTLAVTTNCPIQLEISKTIEKSSFFAEAAIRGEHGFNGNVLGWYYPEPARLSTSTSASAEVAGNAYHAWSIIAYHRYFLNSKREYLLAKARPLDEERFPFKTKADEANFDKFDILVHGAKLEVEWSSPAGPVPALKSYVPKLDDEE